MNDSTPVSMEELFNTHTTAQALSEANAFKTVPTNYYKLQGTKGEAKRSAMSTEFPNGRLTLNLRGDVYKDDKRVGSVGFFVSPDVKRTDKGKLDREIRLYNQIMRALYPEIKTDAELAQINAGEMVARFTQYPIGAFVTETFASDPDPGTGKKSYQDAKTDTEATELRTRGWKPANYVQSIGRVKL